MKRRRATKKREEAAEYQKLLAQRLKEAKERKLERRRSASHSKSSVTRTDSTSSADKDKKEKKWTDNCQWGVTVERIYNEGRFVVDSNSDNSAAFLACFVCVDLRELNVYKRENG